MIAAWMLYCVGIGLALTVAAYAAERALYLAGRPTRWAWSVALLGTLLLPLAATVRPQAFRAIPVPVAEPTRAPPTAAVAAVPQGTVPSTAVSRRALSLSDFDGVLLWGWGLASVTALLVLAAAAARLVALRRRWRTALVDGRSVLLADDVGPAVAGLWPPRVVIPVWALNLTDTQRRLILAHEDEHVRARDPWLLAAGTAALVLAPWNLALWWLSQRLRLAVEMDCDARLESWLQHSRLWGTAAARRTAPSPLPSDRSRAGRDAVVPRAPNSPDGGTAAQVAVGAGGDGTGHRHGGRGRRMRSATSDEP